MSDLALQIFYQIKTEYHPKINIRLFVWKHLSINFFQFFISERTEDLDTYGRLWEIFNSLQSYFTRPVFICLILKYNRWYCKQRGRFSMQISSIIKLYKKFGEYLMFLCSKLKQMLNYSDPVEILRQEQYESKLQFNTSFQTRQAERYP